MVSLVKIPLLIMVLLVAMDVSIARPKYIDCVDTSECPVGTCCVLGNGKFSIPTCMPYIEHGERCRPSGDIPEEASLTYPDAQVVNMTIFYTLCPCSHGLYCSHRSGICEHSEISTNDLGDGDLM